MFLQSMSSGNKVCYRDSRTPVWGLIASRNLLQTSSFLCGQGTSQKAATARFLSCKSRLLYSNPYNPARPWVAREPDLLFFARSCGRTEGVVLARAQMMCFIGSEGEKACETLAYFEDLKKQLVRCYATLYYIILYYTTLYYSII